MNTEQALDFIYDQFSEGFKYRLTKEQNEAIEVLCKATQWQPMETAPLDRRSILIKNTETGFLTTCKRTALKINGKPANDWYADYYDRHGDYIRVESLHQCVWKEVE